MISIDTEIKITTTVKAVEILLLIRTESCDGKTKIRCTPENDYKVAILQKLELVDSRIVAPELDQIDQQHDIGVTPKGRDLCRELGFY